MRKDIFLSAAKVIDAGDFSFSCLAIRLFNEDKYAPSIRDECARQYLEMFGFTEGNELELWNMGTKKVKQMRVLMLCLAAEVLK